MISNLNSTESIITWGVGNHNISGFSLDESAHKAMVKFAMEIRQ